MDVTILLLSVFAIFIPALMLPGPDFVAVVRSAMAKGTSAGFATTVGVSMGLGFYASLSLLGLSAVLVEYQWLAWLVRVLGGCYLVYLGVVLVFSKPAVVEVSGRGDEPGRNALLFGFLVTLTNPKAIVLFTSVFATSVTVDTPLWVMVVMIALVVASSLVWYSIVCIFMSSTLVLNRFKHAQNHIERAAGVCFVAIGGRVLADSRNPITH